MKILRIPLVIGLIVLAGPTFHANAQTGTNLYSFGAYSTDGDHPQDTLVQGSDGNFYGTTFHGGTSALDTTYGYGTVFRISPGGTYTNLYSFGVLTNDGIGPIAGLVQGSDGIFYGTTVGGGTNNDGTVFRISPSGAYTNLHSFGSYPDGIYPQAGLVEGNDGYFYGTTEFGGSNGVGTVFRISSSGSETVLYSFTGSPNGQQPYAGLVQGKDGNFYGVAAAGGTNNNGTVFRITPGGAYTNLYSFTGSPNDGSEPFTALVPDNNGNFYGTAPYDGTSGNGTIFRISSSGAYTNLYSFAGPPNDASYPNGLVRGSDGNFYGMSLNGGAIPYGGSGMGTIFRISPSGSETMLYSFGGTSPSPLGISPEAGLVQGSDGSFYGTTFDEGTHGVGTVFKWTVSLGAPANKISAIQVVGTNVVVTVPSVAGQTYQLQYRSSLTAGSWSNIVGAAVTSIGGSLTVTNLGGLTQAHQFYRFVITP